jgi:hypothetical protein
MAMTKKTTTTWTSIPTTEGFVEVRTSFVQTALTAGKTDSLEATTIGEFKSERKWVDEAAANEWISFLNTTAPQHSLTQTTTLSDI